MHPKKYKDMMSWLTRNKSTNLKDHIVDTLNKYEDAPNVKAKPDILRNMLIEEMKTRDLDSDEIRYLMDTKDRTELPKATPKQTAFIQKKVAPKPFKKVPKELKFDPTPTVPTPTMIFDPLAEEQQQKFNNLLKEVEAEKTRNRTEGLAGLLGGKKTYV
jgi:hypothetical protein|tara:strand:+ start:35 stop:511 length:477 start_codon:yes stop_codon:yes gene_type:complete